MDNAIEANKKLPLISEGYIQLKSRIHQGYFVYSVANKISQQPIEENDRFHSHKENRKDHGWGLVNVQQIVDKYHGTLDIAYDQEQFSLTLIIPIKEMNNLVDVQ